jgi:hypothetical protein
MWLIYIAMETTRCRAQRALPMNPFWQPIDETKWWTVMSVPPRDKGATAGGRLLVESVMLHATFPLPPLTAISPSPFNALFDKRRSSAQGASS